MPKYVALIYGDETQFAHATPEDGAKMMKAYDEYTEALRASGIFEAGEGLQGTNTATTVRFHNGEVSTTDGPFAETKEKLAGFYLIEAADLNDAIQVASKIPPAREGSVEVRPIRQLQA